MIGPILLPSQVFFFMLGNRKYGEYGGWSSTALLLIQCGFVWKETLQLKWRKVEFNARQVSWLWHNSFLVSLWTFQPTLVYEFVCIASQFKGLYVWVALCTIILRISRESRQITIQILSPPLTSMTYYETWHFVFSLRSTLFLTRSLREPGGPCTKSMEVSDSRMERVIQKRERYMMTYTVRPRKKTEPWNNGMLRSSCGVYDYYHIYFMNYD